MKTSDFDHGCSSAPKLIHKCCRSKEFSINDTQHVRDQELQSVSRKLLFNLLY